MQPSMPSQTRPLRGPRRRRFGCLTLLVLLVGVLVLVNVLPTPWALHIGGRFTPLESWAGYGQIKASNGGRYVLSANVRGGIIGTRGRPECDDLTGGSPTPLPGGWVVAFRGMWHGPVLVLASRFARACHVLAAG